MSDKVFIECLNCGHSEEVNLKFFAKLLGGAAVGFGGYAWVTFLFAGTGLAFAICVAIVAGGVAMMAFSEEITEWISGHYSCPKCGKRNWKMMTEKEKSAESRLNHTKKEKDNIERKYNRLNVEIKETINNVSQKQDKVHQDLRQGINDIKQKQDETNKVMREGFDEIYKKLDAVSKSLAFYKEEVVEMLNDAFSEEERERIINEFTNQVLSKIEFCFKKSRDSDRYKEEEYQLKLTFGDEWNKLMDNSKTSLITAKVMFKDMSMSGSTMDYSGVCILVTKAFESELKERFYHRFKEFLNRKYGNDYKKWSYALLKKGNSTPIESNEFTLGSVVPVLCVHQPGHVSNDRFSVSKNVIMDYCKGDLFNSNSKNDVKENILMIARSVNKIKDKYRNPAAHTKSLELGDAKKCFDDVVDIEKMMIKFLNMCKS